jgi:ABC-2 type transport system permease protein
MSPRRSPRSCRDRRRSRGATAPISVLLSGSYILMFFALSNPTSPWVTALSFVPPAAPIFMPMPIAEVGVAAWQVGLKMALAVAALVALTWLAGRVYATSATRIGMRMPFLEAVRG